MIIDMSAAGRIEQSKALQTVPFNIGCVTIVICHTLRSERKMQYLGAVHRCTSIIPILRLRASGWRCNISILCDV